MKSYVKEEAILELKNLPYLVLVKKSQMMTQRKNQKTTQMMTQKTQRKNFHFQELLLANIAKMLSLLANIATKVPLILI